LIRRIAGVVVRPRATLAAVAHQPAWITTWLVILCGWALCGGWLLSTDVGEQALVDERVRVVESLGGTVSDAQYTALQQAPPWAMYFTSGGRLLLWPLTSLVVAAAVVAVARAYGARATFVQALALVVHASVALLIGQLVATPLHYVRESLTSPLNLAAVLPLIEDGTLAARFFGIFDVFVLWWAALLAIGLSVLTGERARHFAGRIAALFLVFAGLTAAVIAALGGA
jgi:hypothetical protein